MVNTFRNRLWLPVAVLCGSVTCTGSSGESGVIRYDVDRIEHVRSVSPILGSQDLRQARNLIIGTDFGDPLYEFGQIWDLEVDRSGFFFVLDALRHEVLKYDETGRFVTRFGRDGEGPGEVRFPSELTWAGDTLGVWDSFLRRLSYFSTDGTYLRSEQRSGWRVTRGLHRTIDGLFLVQLGPVWRSPPQPEVDGVAEIVLFTPPNFEPGEALTRWNDSSSTVSHVARGLSATAVIPFGSRPSWTPAPDRSVYVHFGSEFSILQLALDGTVRRVIERAHEPVRLTPFEKDSAERKVRDYSAPLRDKIEIPERKPAIGRMVTAPDGSLWVRTYTERDRQVHQWDVFDSSGAYVKAMLLPPRADVRLVTRSSVYAVARDSLGVVRVERYAY